MIYATELVIGTKKEGNMGEFREDDNQFST
jgi:hypothetical protein